jgi:hypothetical protein
MLHWLFAFPVAVTVAVVGNARIGADAGTRQDQYGGVAVDKISQPVGLLIRADW